MLIVMENMMRIHLVSPLILQRKVKIHFCLAKSTPKLEVMTELLNLDLCPHCKVNNEYKNFRKLLSSGWFGATSNRQVSSTTCLSKSTWIAQKVYIPLNKTTDLVNMILFSKTLTKGASYPSYTTSSRSSIQMLPIISGLVEKQNPEIGNKKKKIKIRVRPFECMRWLL